MPQNTAQEPAQEVAQRTVSYVYGIVPADVEANPDARGIGDPPSPITVIRHGDVAALVSELPGDGELLGQPEDLTAHASVLDSLAGEIPVLPMRFGSIVDDQDAVVDELLTIHHDDFADALRELEGRAEYQLRGRYDEQAILTEVLAENPTAVRLRKVIQDLPEEVARHERMALGELVVEAIAVKRAEDTRQVVDALGELDVTLTMCELAHERDVMQVAILIEVAREAELEELANRFAATWSGRVRMRLLGPLAPYNFVAMRD
jgi:Gas vesicle synthesis protein GvpL/GvpF